MIRNNEVCRVCESTNIVEVFELCPTPPGDLFLPKKTLHLSVECFPLVLALCKSCGYLHTSYVLDPKLSYDRYVYETSVTVGLSKSYREYAEEVVSYSQVEQKSLVVDLGSNDGTALKSFKECGMKVLGVEPNKQIAEIANQNNLETIRDYFSDSALDRILSKYGKASIVTANYMFANIDNVVDFLGNVERLLDDQGLFVIQTGYHPEQMKVNMFDYIYHEHFSYFTVKVLRLLLKKCGMELLHVSAEMAKGGSIRAIAQRRGGERSADGSIDSFIEKEENDSMHEPETYIEFAAQIGRHKEELLAFLERVRVGGHNIVGYGASHSTTTLLHHFGIGEYLDYLVDDNPIKHGLYSPGHHLEVFPSIKLYDDRPENVLVLGWQHRDSIVGRNRKFIEEGGKFIIPLPVLRVIT